jgi:hypothetical protein
VDPADHNAAEQPPGPDRVRVGSVSCIARTLGRYRGGSVGLRTLEKRLVAFFRFRFAAQAEALADQALDRLARRLSDGTAVDSLESYVLGIARLLVLEEENRQRKERLGAVEAMRNLELHRWDGEADPAIPALRACLASLGEEGANFILSYYAADDGAARIERRQRMAAASGMTLNALRNRALRLRLSLEKCVRGRLQESLNWPADRDETSVSDTVGTMEGDTAS